MLKQLTRILFLGSLLLYGIASCTSAQSSATATATATMITPIAIVKSTDMNFGNIAVNSTSAGTVILQTDGNRTATGGVTLPAVTGTVTAASFAVTGESGYTYTISLPSTLNITSGGNTMTVNTFISTPASTGTLTGGSSTLNIGATLIVPAGQASGTYTSPTPFSVTVNYN